MHELQPTSAVPGNAGEPDRHDWPGRAIGVRAPASGETPLSRDEVAVAVKIGLLVDEDQELDEFPIRRAHRSAWSWGIYQPGLRKAGPFDGLLGGVA